MKKTLAILVAFVMLFALLPATVFAATTEVSTAAALADAITAAASGDTIKLTADIIATGTITIDKTLTLDLNGFNLCVPGAGSNNLYVTGGSLTITGSGKIYEKEDNRWLAAVIVTNADAVEIGPNVTLEGWGGLMIPASITKATLFTIRGKINAYDDKGGGSGAGLYTNGTNKNTSTYPTFNIESTAVITSTGTGIYAAGYAHWNIKSGSSISGEESAIGIKAGKLNVLGGTLRATGAYAVPTEGFSNGINASGCAIQIESNVPTYAGNIEVVISGGTIISDNGYALYEYLKSGTPDTEVDSINITGGTLISASGLASGMLLSSELAAKPERINVTSATFVNAEATVVTANADVTYTVIIPASVDFGIIDKSMDPKSVAFPVAVEGALLEDGASITVTNSTSPTPMVMRDKNGTGNKTLEFTIDQNIFTFTGNDTITGHVGCTPANLQAAGAYKGYMTFTVDYVTP